MSSPSRVRKAGTVLALVVLGLIVAFLSYAVASWHFSTGPAFQPGGFAPPPRATVLPRSCSTTISDPVEAVPAVTRARPGDTVCFTGERFADLTIDMSTSGRAGEPISLIGGGATMRTVKVNASYVVVDGFVLSDGAGLKVTGTGLVLRNNVVRNATDDGIACRRCTDATIESNTVWRADGTGLVIDGDRGLVRDNTVNGSVMRTTGDADGIRFFGNRLRLIGNTIKNITASGYPPGQSPHADCFQTYDTHGSRATFDVVIADNVCQNVDVQCLIATGDDQAVVPDGATTIIFQHNNCGVSGSPGVLLEHFPNVVIRNNTFSGSQYRAVLVAKGSVGVTVAGNTVHGRIPLFDVDDESRPGFHAEGNTSR